MATLLHIDTATSFASVCLSVDQSVVGYAFNEEEKNHAAFVQPAIQKICAENKIQLSSVQAIAVSNGPGSYTGLRVGLASAKGLCFALNIPLITLNTLQIMALAAIEASENNQDYLYCSMIDARRDEVFATVYTSELIEVTEQKNLILTPNSFADYLQSEKILFSGSGSEKAQKFIQHENAIFSSVKHNATHMIKLAMEKYSDKDFSNLAYTVPNYGKSFYTTAKKLF